tara:strand:- start:63 stop:293 length:231 start_codon:yes stop_codon:yes gene_type:complete
MEALVAGIIAAVTGLGAITTQVYRRINELDKRIDAVELRVAERYVSKEELSEVLNRIDSHVARIDSKLDRLIETRN